MTHEAELCELSRASMCTVLFPSLEAPHPSHAFQEAGLDAPDAEHTLSFPSQEHRDL